MSIEYCHKCDRNIDTDFDVEHFDNHKLEMNEELEQTYWEAYRALSNLAPKKFKGMSFEEFILWAEEATFTDLKEAK